MNRILIALFTFLFLYTAEHAKATDLRLPASPTRSISAQEAPAGTNWPACHKAATAGAAAAIAQWRSQAVLKNVVVNGVNANGGSVTGPALQPLIEQTMLEAGIPGAVSRGFAAPVSNAWNTWAASLRVPGLAWYPSFACFDGPVAPPTPNVPTPLAALGGNPGPLSASSLKAAIKAALHTQDRDALAAIDGFADDFAAGFSKYRSSAMVTKVMGGGPVPGFIRSPMVNQCGAVVNGQGTMAAGGFVGAWP